MLNQLFVLKNLENKKNYQSNSKIKNINFCKIGEIFCLMLVHFNMNELSQLYISTFLTRSTENYISLPALFMQLALTNKILFNLT